MEITLVGYGNQGKAWAENLRDSGWSVTVSGRAPEAGGNSLKSATSNAFKVIHPKDLINQRGLIALLLPDESIPDFFQKYFCGENSAPEKNSATNRAFIFAHGFSVLFGKIPFSPTDDILLVAPKGIGVKLRENYQKGSGVMGVLGVEQDFSKKSWERATLVAEGLGCGRVGLLKSSFREETFADLISEQAILCGAVPRLVEQSVQFLVQKGIDPKLATYECLHELKLIVDMMVDRGIYGMFQGVSNTAKFGGLMAADELLPRAELNNCLENLWKKIESGDFAKSFASDRKEGFTKLKTRLEEEFSKSLVDRNL